MGGEVHIFIVTQKQERKQICKVLFVQPNEINWEIFYERIDSLNILDYFDHFHTM